MSDTSEPDDAVLATENPFADRLVELPQLARTTPRRLPWIVAGVLLLLVAIVNVAAVPFVRALNGPPDGWKAVLFAMGMGLLGGQIGGLSGVLVWSRGPFLARIMMVWLVGLALFGCWFVGMWSLVPPPWLSDDRLEVAQTIAASLPLISLAVQLPQWMARFYFGWRIAPAGAAAATESLSIRDLLTGTVVAALTITAVRFSQSAEDLTTEVWVGWAIAVGILAVVSALVVLPLLVLIFRCRVLWALLYIAVGSPLLATATIYLIMQVDGDDGGPDRLMFVVLLIAATTCVASTSAPLWLARLAGYRLRLGREV